MKNRYYINILSKTMEVDSKKYREVSRVVLTSKLGGCEERILYTKTGRFFDLYIHNTEVSKNVSKYF